MVSPAWTHHSILEEIISRPGLHCLNVNGIIHLPGKESSGCDSGQLFREEVQARFAGRVIVQEIDVMLSSSMRSCLLHRNAPTRAERKCRLFRRAGTSEDKIVLVVVDQQYFSEFGRTESTTPLADRDRNHPVVRFTGEQLE